MALMCIFVIGIFLQGIYGIKYFIYPIELLEAVNERNEVQLKEKHSESLGGTDLLAHAHGEELNKNNSAQDEYKKKGQSNVQLVEKLIFGNNAEHVGTKELKGKNSEVAETKEFNENNAEHIKFKGDDVTNNIFLRMSEDTRIDAIMNFLKAHMLSTNYFYSEVKRIKEKGIVYDSLRKVAAYLLEHPKFKNSTVECFHKSKIVKPENVAMWSQSPNNLLIDVMEDRPN